MTVLRVTFALLREGPSDDGLIPHLASLILRAGGTEAIGQSRDYTGTPASKLQRLRVEGTDIDLVFVHRDADRVRASVRPSEVEEAVSASGVTSLVVPVVPVQELEAWLLTDEAAVRTVVGRPTGRADLGLPRLATIEQTAAPKEVLRAALLAASETTGRRRVQERKDFEQRRRTLLDRLDIDGPVRRLAAWQQLEADVASSVAVLADRAGPASRPTTAG